MHEMFLPYKMKGAQVRNQIIQFVQKVTFVRSKMYKGAWQIFGSRITSLTFLTLERHVWTLKRKTNNISTFKGWEKVMIQSS